MMWRDIATLIQVSFNQNEYGDPFEVTGTTQVFVNKKSVRQSEFYQAHAVAFRPELMLEVRVVDYQGQQQVVFEGKTYHIIRTHSNNGEVTELVCQSLVNQGGDF
jgi:hypothetical protein